MDKHPDVVWSPGSLGREQRWQALGIRGATIWLTGLSGSGKSTVATALEEHLIAHHRPGLPARRRQRPVRSEQRPRFDRAGRDENVRRVAEVASSSLSRGWWPLVALISPYAAARTLARSLHESAGIAFIEVYVATPVAVCASRDPKGYYARARTGAMVSLTGVDDPYEVPPPRSWSSMEMRRWTNRWD